MSIPNTKLNTPIRISVAMPIAKLPTQRAMPDAAVTIADNAFHNAFPMSFNVIPISSNFRLLLVSFGLGGSGRFFFFSPLRMSEISLCRLPTASVVFVSGASQRSGLDDARFVGQNTTWACEGGDFSGQPQAAWPCSSVLSRNYLCPSNENDILMLVLKEAWKRRHTHGEVKGKRERMVWRNAP